MSVFLATKKSAIIGAIIILAGILFSLPKAHAQTSAPVFLVTWKSSNSYIPSFYQGKALPSYGSRVTAAVELVSGGKLLDLRSQDIVWFLDDSPIGGGIGAQQITFTPFGAPPDFLSLTVKLPNLNGGMSHNEQIPLVEPVAVIYAPYPNNTFSSNPLVVTAMPFFFNASSTSDLAFIWQVNGQTGGSAENPQEADISIPAGTQSGTSLNVTLVVSNPVGSTDATANQTLTYRQGL